MGARLFGHEFLAEKREEIGAERINRDQEYPQKRRPIERLIDDIGVAERKFPGDRQEDGVFAIEAGEWNHARHRQAADEKRPVRGGHDPPQAAEAADVDHAAHRVHHAPRGEKQQRLEKRMRDQVEYAGRHAQDRAGAQRQKHIAQMTDRRVGEDPLQVGLRHGNDRAQQGGQPADDRHHVQRQGRSGEKRHAPRDHIHPGGDHRRGVDQRADGRGAFHRVRQPDVQRKLRALAAGAEHQQQANRRADRAADDRLQAGQPSLPQNAGDRGRAAGRRIVEIERAVSGPDQKYSQGKAEIADPIDQERLLAGGGRRRLFVPESDEQIAAQADGFPKHVEQ